MNQFKKYLSVSLSLIVIAVVAYFYMFNTSKLTTTTEPLAKKELPQRAQAINYEGAMVIQKMDSLAAIKAEMETNPPASGGTFDLATMAKSITAEALKAYSNSDERSLPLIAHWNVGEGEGMDPMYMMKRIEQGEHILVSWKLDPYYSNSIGNSYYEESIKKAASLGLPLVFVLPAPESALTKDSYYKGLSKEENPNVVNKQGEILNKLSPFAPNSLWKEVGKEWSSTSLMAQIQEWYPNPPLVLFVSKDEAAKLSWSELAESSRYTKEYPSGQNDNYKRILIGGQWIEKYSQMHDGFKQGFSKSAWKNNVKFMSYNNFSQNLGKTSEWIKDSTITNYYMNVWPLTSDGVTLNFDLSGSKNDSTANAPHVTANNLPFMINEAKVLNPNFSYQLNLDDNSKITDPTRYRGLAQFALWFLRPSTIRQASAETTTELQEPLFQELSDSVELIHYNPQLADFWKNGTLVKSGTSDLNASIPEQYKNAPRWFLLDTDANPKRSWSDNTNIKVWAFALVKGKAPNRAWLVYTQSPEGNRTDVTVSVPGYKDVLLNTTEEGSFYSISESKSEIIALGNTTENTTENNIQKATPIFPTAKGPIDNITGGQGGKIIEVTNLNPSGPGSLRYAVESKGRRIIIFKVSGVIDLQGSNLEIKNPNITILGQTAPEGGITIANTTFIMEANNVILQYLSIRSAREIGNRDSLGFKDGGFDIIVDHCSISWATDENIGIWTHDIPAHNIVFSSNLVADALSLGGKHNMAVLAGSPTNAEEMHDIVFYRNVFANASHRMPEVKIKSTKIINNIMYHWRFRGITLSGGINADIIGNHFIAGPTPSKWEYQPITIRTDEYLLSKGENNQGFGPTGPASVYIKNNIFTTNNKADSGLETSSNPLDDNWNLITSVESVNIHIDKKYERQNPMNAYKIPLSIQPILSAQASILQEAGNSMRINKYGKLILNRGPIDTKIIEEVENDSGTLKSTLSDVGGFPVIQSKNGYLDTDGDGISDTWEEHYGLNPNDPQDALLNSGIKGYNNLEAFIYGLKPIN